MKDNANIKEAHQDSYSLDPKLRVLKGLSTMKVRFINYLNRVDATESQSRFGSCNEFTLGMNDGKEKLDTSTTPPVNNINDPSAHWN